MPEKYKYWIPKARNSNRKVKKESPNPQSIAASISLQLLLELMPPLKIPWMSNLCSYWLWKRSISQNITIFCLEHIYFNLPKSHLALTIRLPREGNELPVLYNLIWSVLQMTKANEIRVPSTVVAQLLAMSNGRLFFVGHNTTTKSISANHYGKDLLQALNVVNLFIQTINEIIGKKLQLMFKVKKGLNDFLDCASLT